MTYPRFSAFVRIRPSGETDGLIHSDPVEDDGPLAEVIELAARPLDLDDD